MRKKIAILSLHLGYGGVEKAITSLANSLAKLGKYDIEIVSIYKLYEKSVFDIDEKENSLLSDEYMDIVRGFFYDSDINGQLRLFIPFDFSIIPIELVSSIYENFLNYKQYENKSYYTPAFLVDYIINTTVTPFLNNKKNSKNISINESIGFDKDGNEISFLDILKTPDPDFAMDIHLKDNIGLLKKYFNVLTEREKDIVIKRYGLNGEKEITQKEIAKELKISRSYVSRIEKRALTKILREFIKNKKAN